MGYRVAVVGATGNVGRELLNILAERQFPLDEVAAVASARSTGDVDRLRRQRRGAQVKNLEHFDFAGWDMALFAAGADVSKAYAPEAARGGLHRDRQQLAVPDGPGRPADRAGGELGRDRRLCQEEHHRQPQLLDGAAGGRAEAAARCREDQARRRRDLPVGLGRRQSAAWTSCSNSRATSSSAMPTSRKSIPSRSPSTSFRRSTSFLDDGSTKEEWKMVVETKKILDP